MKYTPETLKSISARVRQERISVQHGSPSDAEIGQAQLADIAADYIPGLIEALSAAEARTGELQAELAEQETAALQWAKTLAEYNNELSRLRAANENAEQRKVLLHEALLFAISGLERSYDVCDYPGNGTSIQDKALENAKLTLAQVVALEMLAPTPPPSSPAAAGPGEAGWFSPLVFDSAADYDASVESVTGRIESGEIQPREADEEEARATRFASIMHGVREINGKEKLLRKLEGMGVFDKKDPEPAGPPTTGEGGSPRLELRADRVGFDSPEYAARIEKVQADVESLKSHNPNRRD